MRSRPLARIDVFGEHQQVGLHALRLCERAGRALQFMRFVLVMERELNRGAKDFIVVDDKNSPAFDDFRHLCADLHGGLA